MPYYFQTLLPLFISLTVKGRSSATSQHNGPKGNSDRTQSLNGNECPHLPAKSSSNTERSSQRHRMVCQPHQFTQSTPPSVAPKTDLLAVRGILKEGILPLQLWPISKCTISSLRFSHMLSVTHWEGRGIARYYDKKIKKTRMLRVLARECYVKR